MEGSARREGTHVRISAILIRVADQTQQWADSFDRELAGILALQSDVARSIGASLQLTLLPAEQTRLASSGQVNPDAYEASLKGRFHADKLTPQDLDVALKYFDLALTIDPTYAPAYTGIALVWNGKTQMGYTMPAEAMPKIKAAATRAIELDDSSAFAHAALAGAAWSEWDWETSEREFRRALELDPGDAKTHAFYSHLLIALNRPDDARRAGQRALDLDPFNDFHRALYGTVLYLIRRYDEATAELGNVVRTSPDHPVAVCALWYTFNALGRPEQALTAAGGCLGHYSGDVKDILAKGFSESGYSGAMRRVGDWLAAGVGGAYIAPIDVFIAYLHAGDKDLALQWLSRIVDARDPNLSGAVRDPFANDSLGHDPRFHEIVRRSKLPV
jgi:tetratricopeptide (TPR) repeat protein